MAEDTVAADDTVESEAVAAQEEAVEEPTEELVAETVEPVVDAVKAPVKAEAAVPVLVEDVRHSGWDGWTVQKGGLPSGIDAPKVNAVTEEQLPDAEKFAVNGGDIDSALRLVARAAE